MEGFGNITDYDMSFLANQLASIVAFVWAPNLSQGYPYGGNKTFPISNEDLALLDTNQNGVLDKLDDPFTPYWFVQQYIFSIY